MATVEELVYALLEVLIAVGCCLGNLLVLSALWSSRKLRQPTFCLICSLSVADLLVGCVTIPLALVVDGRVETSFYRCLFSSCFIVMLPVASILALLAIAVDRYLRVSIPLRYKTIVTARRSWAAVAACWLVAAALTFPPVLGLHGHEALSTSANSTIVCAFVAVIPMSYLVNVVFLCSLVILFVMAALYCYIFFTIRRQTGGCAQTQAYLSKERSLAGSLALVLALFALCWLPLHVMNAVSYFGRPSDVPIMVVHAGILLSHANSAVNPVVYAFKIQTIRKKVLQFWRRCVVRGDVCGDVRGDEKPAQESQCTENNASSNQVTTEGI